MRLEARVLAKGLQQIVAVGEPRGMPDQQRAQGVRGLVLAGGIGQ